MCNRYCHVRDIESVRYKWLAGWLTGWLCIECVLHMHMRTRTHIDPAAKRLCVVVDAVVISAFFTCLVYHFSIYITQPLALSFQCERCSFVLRLIYFVFYRKCMSILNSIQGQRSTNEIEGKTLHKSALCIHIYIICFFALEISRTRAILFIIAPFC